MNTFKLNNLRDDFNRAKTYLAYAEEKEFSKETRDTFERYLAKSRYRLLQEIHRISRLLWPETGRPYAGDWAVINRFNDYHCIINTQRHCLKWIEQRRTLDTPTLKYYVTKWPR